VCQEPSSGCLVVAIGCFLHRLARNTSRCNERRDHGWNGCPVVGGGGWMEPSNLFAAYTGSDQWTDDGWGVEKPRLVANNGLAAKLRKYCSGRKYSR